MDHKKYESKESDMIVITSEDSSQKLTKHSFLGKKMFKDQDEYADWFIKINNHEPYGSCSASYRAYRDIVEEE